MLRVLLFVSIAALASPSGLATFQPQAAPDNTVHITDASDFCMIMPRSPHTTIGDSEHPGGMRSYCSSPSESSPKQGQLPDDFWKTVQYKKGLGKNGKPYVQLTGCINPDHFSQLNRNDPGGQYDSSGGVGGHGNPEGSVCLGYSNYVELVEPAGPRACIRCCEDPVDCPTSKDTQGCPNVIPGDYVGCN
ncbi:hypothetical protein C8J57DRAFT_692817 [Mycena rebaudengoi]|nr:hypothetical protein C8J57DRAFT_692817 [Mycena rebaudengoi]